MHDRTYSFIIKSSTFLDDNRSHQAKKKSFCKGIF
nr:MAG TPA: hypothetical protein [Caudoviricetes sp.]